MTYTSLGYSKQVKDENVGSWGTLVNANMDLLNAIQAAFIASTARNRFVLEVFPTDDVGTLQIEESLKHDQLAVGIDDLNLDTILQAQIGTGEETFPVASDTQYNTRFASLEIAINHITARRAAEAVTLGPWLIILHPGEHVVDSSIIIPDNCIVLGSGHISEITLDASTITIDSENSKLVDLYINTADATSMVLVQSQALFTGLLISGCLINAPLVIDTYNQADGVGGNIMNNIFTDMIKFACTGGTSVVDDALYFLDNRIGKNKFQIGDTADATDETDLSIITPNSVLVVQQYSDMEARLYDLMENIKDAANFAALQATMVTLQGQIATGRVVLSGTTGSTSMGTSPIMKGNMYV